MKKVIATGTFSIIHPGHLLFLEEAKKLADELIVIVARDRNIKKRKNNAIIPEKQRLNVVKALRVVDKAILGDNEDIFKPIMEIKPDFIALGKDQEFDEDWLKEELKKRKLKAKVVRIDKYLSGELNSSRKIVESIRKC